MNTISDATARQWCQQIAAGHTEAATELVRAFYQPIFAYLRRLTGNDADAGDLTQVTFAKVWQSAAQFRGASSVATWIYRIAYFSYVDWRRRAHPATEQSDDWWASLPAGEPMPFEAAVSLETAQLTYRAVDRLPEEIRQTVHLHYYQSLSLAETAEILEIPVSTLKYRLRSALETLRRELQEPPIGENYERKA